MQIKEDIHYTKNTALELNLNTTEIKMNYVLPYKVKVFKMTKYV